MQNEPAPQLASARFLLDAEPSPCLLSRVLEPFAKRALTPERMWSHRGKLCVHVEVAVDEAPAEVLPLIEGNLRQIVGVLRVAVVRREALREAA